MCIFIVISESSNSKRAAEQNERDARASKNRRSWTAAFVIQVVLVHVGRQDTSQKTKSVKNNKREEKGEWTGEGKQ